MSVRTAMIGKLQSAFAPVELTVVDDSDRHMGHGGWRDGGETHFSIHVVSETFRGKSRLERHRLVHAVLADELAGGVHALAIKAVAPGE